jgi:uncharacterized protein YecE (DUF72 family)
MTIKIGCAGFPVSRKNYEAQFGLVELKPATGTATRAETNDRWRTAAPAAFEFVVSAPLHISHPATARDAIVSGKRGERSLRSGVFDDSAVVRRAVAQTLEQAERLAARLVLFSLPETAAPQADNVAKLQSFFRALPPQKDRHYVWEPPAFWPVSFVDTISRSLSVTPVTNPFAKPPWPNAAIRYIRLKRKMTTLGSGFSDAQLSAVKSACDRPESYVIFATGPTAFKDAVRFKEKLRMHR